MVSAALLEVSSLEPVPTGRHALRFEFEPTGPADLKAGKGVPGRVQLYVDGRLVGQSTFPLTVPITYGLGCAVLCGADDGSTVTPAFASPFAFTGTIEQVTVDVSGELIVDDDALTRSLLGRQ